MLDVFSPHSSSVCVCVCVCVCGCEVGSFDLCVCVCVCVPAVHAFNKFSHESPVEGQWVDIVNLLASSASLLAVSLDVIDTAAAIISAEAFTMLSFPCHP